MAVYKFSTNSLKTPLKYSSLLAGNAVFVPFEPSGAYDSIATANGNGSSGVITFSSIPSTYTHLQIRFIGLTSVNPVDVSMKVNSTVVGLRDHYSAGYGSSPAGSNTDTPGANGVYVSPQGFGGSTNPTVGVIDFLDYTNTNKYKTARSLNGRDQNGSGYIALVSYLYDTTSAISSITFTVTSGNFATTTQFALYGIKGA